MELSREDTLEKIWPAITASGRLSPGEPCWGHACLAVAMALRTHSAGWIASMANCNPTPQTHNPQRSRRRAGGRWLRTLWMRRSWSACSGASWSGACPRRQQRQHLPVAAPADAAARRRSRRTARRAEGGRVHSCSIAQLSFHVCPWRAPAFISILLDMPASFTRISILTVFKTLTQAASL